MKKYLRICSMLISTTLLLASLSFAGDSDAIQCNNLPLTKRGTCDISNKQGLVNFWNDSFSDIYTNLSSVKDESDGTRTYNVWNAITPEGRLKAKKAFGIKEEPFVRVVTYRVECSNSDAESVEQIWSAYDNNLKLLATETITSSSVNSLTSTTDALKRLACAVKLNEK